MMYSKKKKKKKGNTLNRNDKNNLVMESFPINSKNIIIKATLPVMNPNKVQNPLNTKHGEYWKPYCKKGNESIKD